MHRACAEHDEGGGGGAAQLARAVVSEARDAPVAQQQAYVCGPRADLEGLEGRRRRALERVAAPAARLPAAEREGAGEVIARCDCSELPRRRLALLRVVEPPALQLVPHVHRARVSGPS
eukprot:764944-Hanusia_phi.AAC.5